MNIGYTVLHLNIYRNRYVKLASLSFSGCRPIINRINAFLQTQHPEVRPLGSCYCFPYFLCFFHDEKSP